MVDTNANVHLTLRGMLVKQVSAVIVVCSVCTLWTVNSQVWHAIASRQKGRAEIVIRAVGSIMG